MPRCSRMNIALVALMVSGTILLAGQSPRAKRQPVPSAEAQARSETLIQEIFKGDFANAREPATQAKLADYLFQQGKESKDDPANRYMLYQHSRKLAAQAGDTTLALSAVAELVQEFELDEAALKAATIKILAEHVSTPEGGKAVVDLALRLLAEALDADNYDAATDLAAFAETAARKGKSVPLVSQVQKKQLEVAAARKSFARLQAYLDQLKKTPDDPEANFELGWYYGPIRNRWDKAVPYLARGRDPALRIQAQKDLANPKNPQEQVALADGWWDLALLRQGAEKLHLQQRAVHWYDQAVGKLTGLSRTKALRRAEQIATQGKPASSPLITGPVGEIRKLEGHTQEVRGVAISPEGRFGLSGSFDFTARLWELTTGKEVRALRNHTKEVWGVAFVPGGRQLVTASWDGTVRLWDVATGVEVRRFAHPKDVNGVAVSRDGKYLLTGSDDMFLRLWDLSSGQEIRSYRGANDFVYGVAFSPDGRLVAAGSKDGSARVYDLATGQLVRAFSEHTGDVTAVAFSPDSLTLYTCGDSAAHQWQISTGKELKRFPIPVGRVQALALSSDGRRLLTGGDDNLLRLWDTATGKEIQAFQGHSAPIYWVTLSSDDRHALSASRDNTVRLWGLPAK